MDYTLEIIAFSSFMTFVCSASILVYIVMKEQAWAQTIDWIRDSLNAIKYNAGGIDGNIGAIFREIHRDPNRVNLQDVLDGIEDVTKEVRKARKQK